MSREEKPYHPERAKGPAGEGHGQGPERGTTRDGSPRVLFVSPEASPLAMTGGLGDVAGALPQALLRLGADVRVVLPFYRGVRKRMEGSAPVLTEVEVPLGGQDLRCAVREGRLGRVPLYLLDREDLYDRPNLYAAPRGDYYDNLERFTFLCHAALRIPGALSWTPDVVHCHDWQTGLVAPLLKGPYRGDPSVATARMVFTIHNAGYQGLFPAEKLEVTGLSRAECYHPEGLEYWGSLSLLKAGAVYSDALTTVSSTYAREICTPELGLGMEGVFRARGDSLKGILNGADYGRWDPARDPHIAAGYGPGNMQGKSRCRKALVQETGLDGVPGDRPILGVVSRLDRQKGMDLLAQALPELVALDTGIVILGNGDMRIQEALERAAAPYAGRVSLRIGFDEGFSHRIMAGADFLLVPSLYEPCGLTQIYALRYGTIPVARATGGLKDTIRDGENGFLFEPYDAGALAEAVKRAVRAFSRKKEWPRMVRNAMSADFSWDRSAALYMELYEALMGRKAGGVSAHG
ncbi:MAG: glycogen synthase GlgA [Deltaproteobacteria bacterium]|nr:glycogen synthase GlgA [Deltaproteobacteria bacterium]